MKPKINFLFAEQTFGLHMFVCTLTLPGQNLDADLSENRTGSVCKTSLLYYFRVCGFHFRLYGLGLDVRVRVIKAGPP